MDPQTPLHVHVPTKECPWAPKKDINNPVYHRDSDYYNISRRIDFEECPGAPVKVHINFPSINITDGIDLFGAKEK